LSSQDRDAGDFVEVHLNQQKLHVRYFANGSRVLTDAKHRHQVLNSLIETAQLPLVLEKKGRKYCLRHSGSGALRIYAAQEPNGTEPSAFECEYLSPATIADIQALLQHLQQFVTENSSMVFSSHWRLEIISSENPDINSRRVELVANKLLHIGVDLIPNQIYHINFFFRLRTIDELGVLSSASSAIQDDIIVDLCSFCLPASKRRYTIQVHCMPQGLKLILSASNPPDTEIQEISRIFGTSFQPIATSK
jgi:hypothetical protein